MGTVVKTYRYQIGKAQDYYSKVLSLPVGTKAIKGILICTDAIANQGLGGGHDNTDTNRLPSILALRSSEALRKGKFNAESLGSSFGSVEIGRFALGMVSIRAYNKSQLFHMQPIWPASVDICALSNIGSFRSYRWNIHQYQDKTKLFGPVSVDGQPYELQVQFEPYQIAGQTNLRDFATITNEQRAAENVLDDPRFVYGPYNLIVILQLETDN